MEMQVIKTKPTLELQEHEEQLRAQLFALRIQKALGKLETPHIINQLRKDIARIKTELSFRILAGELIKPLNVIKMTLPEEKSKKEKTTKTKKVKAETTAKAEIDATKKVKKIAKPKPKTTKKSSDKKPKIAKTKEGN